MNIRLFPMKTSTKFAFLLIHLLTIFVQKSNSTKTIVVDGDSMWKDPSVVAGDTIIFKNKYNYSLYIFRNERAFQLCNFTQAALLLTNSNSTSFTWHPSRPGFFYFSFNNGSAQPCLEGHKLAIKVTITPPSPSPEPSPVTSPVTFPATSPAPTPGGIVSTPSFPWPFRPHEALSPVSAPLPPLSSSPAPEDGDGAMPFISSNPAVTVPKGAVDSATIRPVSTSSRHASATSQVVGMFAIYKVLCCVFLMMLL